MSATLPTNAVVKVLADLLIGTDPAGIYKNDLRADYTLNLEADLIETNTRGFQHSSSAVDIAVAHMPQPYVQMNCVNRSLSGSRNPDSEYISFGLSALDLNHLVTSADLLPSKTATDPGLSLEKAAVPSIGLLQIR